MTAAKATLITCHANADFDAFAAMLAARHLYSPHVLLFPGSQERGLQKLYASIDTKAYSFADNSDLDWESFDRLVIVDTRQRSRVSHVAPLLERLDVAVEMWDHHPDSGDDIQFGTVHLAHIGSVTSLIVQHLRERGVRLEAADATLLGLGIYGDTGSFTYSSTTPADFEAAAWLLGQGMDVNRINDLAAHELTSMHIQALNSLLESAESFTINRTQVVLAEAAMEHYLGDFAYLAHRLIEMEKFTVLFAIGLMGDRIQVVARSRSEKINVGDICAALGGGGHAYAASASIRHMTLHEVRDAILRQLYEQAHPDKTAREYMSSPAVGVESTATIREADELMLHFGLKAVPVFSPGTRTCKGLLDAQTASRASAHGLGEALVEDYMQGSVQTLPPEAVLKDLTAIIVGARQRLVPIVETDRVIGVVTRTDLINVFAHEQDSLPVLKHSPSKERHVGKLIQDRLPSAVKDLLQLAGKLGRDLGLPVYAVGGFVRDLLLNRPNQDIDLVVEGNGITLAKALAVELGGRVREHQEFLTSVVIFKDEKGQESRIDVATARLEYYEYPAALPTVELSSIKMDLFRRDFSINALAVRLDSTPFGQLIDFFGGQRDIKERVIRVLHTLSFVEDPTRCLRAVRFEQRYDFRIGAGAERLIKNALGLKLMDKLAGPRLFSEFRHICDEDNPLACFVRLDQLGILPAIAPQLALIPTRRGLLQELQDMLSWYHLLYFEKKPQDWLVYFLGLSHGLPYAETSDLYRRLGLPENKRAEILNQREQMRTVRGRLEAWQRRQDGQAPKISALCEVLAPLSLESLLYLMAETENEFLQKSLSRYITQWQYEKADITGDDLKALGLPPGPLYSHILRTALKAKLDGETQGREAQLGLAHALMRQEQERKARHPSKD
ncbi:MAG: polya polymerase [Desulfovibrio sp. MES5]|uniref:CBS domain-containing protein n=1 Tax=Desulfovibrio sp. MES5 TaxID=1899016 RepID=UPI000B9D2B97|nr:CBS domain-containing protein [Desulfovibrio sp. MES5]OXS28502.1 MAG: polya polymerase [Desulfovibrio sp. MES5]